MGNKIIGINGTILNNNRSDGFGRVTYETIRALSEKSKYLSIFSNDSQNLKNITQIHVPEILSKYGFWGNLTRILWHQINLPVLIKKKNIDIYYSPTLDGMIQPICPQIITIYDLIPIFFPECSPKFRHYYKYIIPLLLKSSKYIIAGSESTKKDIIKQFSYNGSIEVIYPGFSQDKFKPQPKSIIDKVRSKYNLKTYFLCVSEIRSYKNFRRLIKAYVKIKNQSHQLVIVGRFTKNEKDMMYMPEMEGMSDKIKVLGFVPDDDLAPLYAGAYAFLFPSLYEGFGLPPLEAMACGCPVLVANTSSIPEVCNDAGYYFNPYDIESISTAISEVSNNIALRDDLVNKGLNRAKYFSYEKTANELLNLFERI